MESAVTKAIKMMGIALPTMFAVIAIFYVATKLLHRALPAPVEEDDEDDEDDEE